MLSSPSDVGAVAVVGRRFSGAGGERLGDLLRDRQRCVERDRAAGKPLRQILAFDEFHDEKRRRRSRLPFLQPVDRGDVRMIQ